MKLYKKEKHLRILKSLSVKLSETKTFILTYMYYTDKMNKDNNQYRYEGLVVDNAELEGKIRKMESEPNLPWHWGNNIPDSFVMLYHNDTNREGASFLKGRLKKALTSFDEFLEKANENPVKRYPLTDYEVSDGTKIDLKDKELLLRLYGKTISHVRDRAEKTFDVYDPNKKFKRYKSNVKERMERERAIAERKAIRRNGQQQ